MVFVILVTPVTTIGVFVQDATVRDELSTILGKVTVKVKLVLGHYSKVSEGEVLCPIKADDTSNNTDINTIFLFIFICFFLNEFEIQH